jgi:hypothetical protein
VADLVDHDADEVFLAEGDAVIRIEVVRERGVETDGGGGVLRRGGRRELLEAEEPTSVGKLSRGRAL